MSDEYKPNKKIKDIVPGEKNLELIIILIEKVSSMKIKNESHLTQFLVGDETGCMICNFFDETGLLLKEGDILYLKGAYSSVFKTNLVLYSSNLQFAKIERIGDYFMVFNDANNLSKATWNRIIDPVTNLESYIKEDT